MTLLSLANFEYRLRDRPRNFKRGGGGGGVQRKFLQKRGGGGPTTYSGQFMSKTKTKKGGGGLGHPPGSAPGTQHAGRF